MGENPIKVTGIQKQPQQFSTTGIKLSTLKEQNELLFNYFKTNGYKEDAIIYSSDVDKITKSADTNDNEKLSIKEAREMGLEGSRKEIRSALNQLKEIKNSELAPNVSGNYPVVINENETEFYNKDGVLLSNTKNFENGGKLETFYLKGDKNKVVPNSKEQQEVNNKPTITSQHVHKNTTEAKKVNHSKPTTQAKPLHNNQQQKVAAASTKTNKTNTKTNKKTSKKTPTRKVKTPYNAIRQTRITKAKNVNYEMKRDVPARVETAIQSPDYRAFVTKSRLGYSKRLNDHNTKNTLCQVAKTQNTTLPSLVLEYYSSKNPPVTQEPEWSLKNALKNPTPWLKKTEKPKTYDKDSVIMNLKFIKEHIEAAKAIGYDIPKALYEYIPKQNASEEVVKQEIQVYEAVFGKGSSGLLLWF